MMVSKSYNNRSSHSSIKLPRIHKQKLHYRQKSKQLQKINDVSLKLINATNIDNQSKQKHSLLAKSKSKSRAEVYRFKTQNNSKNDITFDAPSLECSINDMELDHTLQQFKKNVQQNKVIIRNEINKNQNKLKNKRSLKSVASLQNSLVKKKSLILNSNQNSSEAKIFQNIHKIIDKNTTIACDLGLDQVKKMLKFSKLEKKLMKFYQKNSAQTEKTTIANTKHIKVSDEKNCLKNQDNYGEWRRVRMMDGQLSPRYQQSNFDNEQKRLSQLVHKTEASLEKYMKQRSVCRNMKAQSLKSFQ